MSQYLKKLSRGRSRPDNFSKLKLFHPLHVFGIAQKKYAMVTRA